MTTTTIDPRVIARTETEPDVTHWVCHCTNDNIAACGRNTSQDEWTEDESALDCPLCALAWPDDTATCPWGCDCDEECAS